MNKLSYFLHTNTKYNGKLLSQIVNKTYKALVKKNTFVQFI